MVRPSATGRPLERPLLVLCQRGTVVAAAAAPRAVHDVSRRAHRDRLRLDRSRAPPRARARAAGHFFDRIRDMLLYINLGSDLRGLTDREPPRARHARSAAAA